jgi:6-pyruvoyltetrahydropterin/6-carboxytetrahydropterin synthase
LNLDVDFMKDKMASTEILAIEFWKILDSKITTISNGRGKLHCVKLYETPRNYVEYYGG